MGTPGQAAVTTTRKTRKISDITSDISDKYGRSLKQLL